MSNKIKIITYESPLAPLMRQLIREKQAAGYKYETPAKVLKDFDRFLCKSDTKPNELSKYLVLQWLEKRATEQASTHQRRIVLIRQLARLMVRYGYPAFLPPNRFGTQRSSLFSPRIFTHKEIKKIIYAVDKIKPSSKSPQRHIIMPELFRLLYGCGFRLSEVLNLRNGDVDLKRGVITVREGKFGKDRLVPPALDIVERLQIYAERMEKNY